MIIKKLFLSCLLASCCFADPLPENALQIMQQPKYKYANWGIVVKEIGSGKTLYDHNSQQMYLPASTTKLFTVAALLDAYGENYRFKTPVLMQGELTEGKLRGNLILVAQGDLTFGGRRIDANHIAYTDLDHIVANAITHSILTPESPLEAFKLLAEQVKQAGINEIEGDIFIDDTLFETVDKRGLVMSPILINENLFDFLINPTQVGEQASLKARPEATGYHFINKIKTVSNGEPLAISIETKNNTITLSGTIPEHEKNVVQTAPIQKPAAFAKAAFIDALKNQGIKIELTASSLTDEKRTQIAEYISAPLSEYAKLILKVSHNVGADLIPLLLAVKHDQKTFDEGMLLFGKFLSEKVKLLPNTYVFIDGAGGDQNRVVPIAELQLLEYMKQQATFETFYDALPILGVDGSLADTGKGSEAAGKIRAKTGTGIAQNKSTGEFFLTTQTLAGYIEAKSGKNYIFMIAVNNGILPKVDDIFAIFNDLSQIAIILYNN